VQADVVYLGETHDNPEAIKLEIIQKLKQRNPKIAIAMECSSALIKAFDRYLAGQVSEQELLSKASTTKGGAFPGILCPFCDSLGKQLPVIALNTPTEVTHKVAREGLESLTPEQRQFIPLSEIRTDNAEYRQLIVEAFQQHQAAAHGSSADESRFFLAQVLWDETMAEESKFLKANRLSSGSVSWAGHIVYGYGIPAVARRLKGKHGSTFSLAQSPEDAPARNDKIADFVWQQGDIQQKFPHCYHWLKFKYWH